MAPKPRNSEQIRQRIEQLEQSKIIIDNKIERLQQLKQLTENEIAKLRSLQ